MKGLLPLQPLGTWIDLLVGIMPALGSLAITCLWALLPHEAVRIGRTGFDVFNVWVMLTGPVAVLVLLSLRRSSLSKGTKVLLGFLNAIALVLSLCLLLVALES